ncbi:MAG: hypothetical protein E6R03_14905 [Hyphomicrobiaceae bacterium]|nr:MAG: hypothetical protein E6R03_14905 [Hyphomicrobiaceae bacterium]
MSFEREFELFMPDTVTIAPFVGRDHRNTRQYGTAKTYRARIVGKGIASRRMGTEDNTVIYDIYTSGVPIGETAMAAFTVDDKVTLPADIKWEDTTPEIFAIGRYTDPDGMHHIKIQCGFIYHRQGQ